MKPFSNRSMNNVWRLAVLAAAALLAAAGDFARAQPPASKAPRVETLSRGLVHEGFVAPVVFDPAPGLVAPKAPPVPLDEQPPAIKPSGARAQWLPGYWSWDAARRTFVWTTGGWRVPPPGMRWIAGYWADTPAGFQWAAGFWAPAAASQIIYLPMPPKYKELPNKADHAAPTEPSQTNQFLVPGYWKPHGGDVVWQPAFWTQAKPGWIWTPARYVWTPAGAAFIAGYWDFPLARRGLLFAPVAVEPVAGVQGGFVYAPQAVVNLTALSSRLFVSAAYRHCGFGDYEPAAEASRAVERRSAFEARGAGVVAIEAAAESGNTSAAEPLVIPISELLRSKATPLALVETGRNARRRAALAMENARAIIARRRKFEAEAGKPQSDAAPLYARTLPLPKLPIELGGAPGEEVSTSAAEVDELPGIDDRRTPGTKDRSVPGLGGRVVPGVRDPLPGIGPLPGADNQR